MCLEWASNPDNALLPPIHQKLGEPNAAMSPSRTWQDWSLLSLHLELLEVVVAAIFTKFVNKRCVSINHFSNQLIPFQHLGVSDALLKKRWYSQSRAIITRFSLLPEYS